MAEIVGQRMSDYTPLEDLTQAEQETYLANAAVTTYGKTSVGGANTNVNVPLSAIKPDVPVTDVTVGGNSVVSNGVAIIPKYYGQYPIMNNGYEFSLDYNAEQFELAGTNNTELTLTNPVPPPGENAHRGEYLKVDDNSDDLVWDTIPTAPTYTAGTGIDITSNTISVTRPVPDPGTNEHRGHVLTVNNSDDSIEWAAPQGGGGGGSDPFSDIAEWDDGKNPPTKVKDYITSPLDEKSFYISVKKDSDIIKHRFLFQYGGSGAYFYGPWAS